MGGLLKGGSGRTRANEIPTPDFTLRIQTSVQGRPRMLVYGQTRVSGNILTTNNLHGILGISGTQHGVAGGKGGMMGKGGGVPSFSWSWYYFIDMIIGFGSVPLIDIPTIWNGSAVGVINDQSCFYNNPNYASLTNTTITALYGQIGAGPTVAGGTGETAPPGASLFGGDYAQSPWPYMVSSNPGIALAYRGEAYVAWESTSLGTSANIPSYNFEVTSSISYDIPSLGPDANPRDVLVDYLTNPDHGVPSFSSSWLADLTSYRDYCRATSMLVSIAENDSRDAASFLSELVKMTNSTFVWSSGLLSVVPYGDVAVTGNGTTWTPNVTPVYSLTDNDFLPNQGGSMSGSPPPVIVTRKPRSEIVNHMRLEYLPRSYFYNAEVIDIVDEAAIETYGLERISDMRQGHMFSLDAAARSSAALLLQREQIVASYVFTVGRRFIMLDPMDIVTISDANLGLANFAVRIQEIQENSDGTLTITAEEFTGTVTAPRYGTQSSLGSVLNYNVSPGQALAPIIFEPPDALANGLEIWMGVCGQSPDVWGGADVYVSYDDVNYTKVGTVSGPSRMGKLSASLATIAAAVSPPTIDSTHTLSVDLSESKNQLLSGSMADLQAANMLAYVDGELLSYQTATLTGAYQYNLTTLNRGLYESTISSHASGKDFLRLDQSVFRLSYTPDRIGSIVYIKFRSFNIFGQGQTDLSTAGSYQYTITGAALSSALPNVSNLRTVFEGGFMKLWWDEVSDFRTGIRYRISKGVTYQSSIPVGDVAHPPFVVFGDDTYWVTAYCTPMTGLEVTSAAAQSLTISGNMLVSNLLVTTDEKAGDWGGTLTNLTASGASGSKVLYCAGASGTYTVPDTHIIDAGRITDLAINAVWQASGVPVGQNILAMADFLNNPDIFGSTAAAFIDSWIEISVASSDPGSNVFSPADAFTASDMFATGSSGWSSWQKFVPGTYHGRYFRLRLQIVNHNPSQVTGVVLGMSFTVSMSPRVDHYQNLTIPPGGLTVTFRPDGSGSNSPFNGGPNNSAVPYVNASWLNQPGDQLLITGLTKSSMTITILNSGVGVTRTGFNVNVEGY